MARKDIWDIKKIEDGFRRFFKDHSRYPTSHEIDEYKYLPSARQIQRKFGGLPKIRSSLKLSGPNDYTKTTHGEGRAKSARRQYSNTHLDIYAMLCKKFGRKCVKTGHILSDDGRSSSDFLVNSTRGTFVADLMYSKDRYSLVGCLNSKIRTYRGSAMSQYRVVFIQMNESIDSEAINGVLARRKIPLADNHKVVGIGALKEYLDTI